MYGIWLMVASSFVESRLKFLIIKYLFLLKQMMIVKIAARRAARKIRVSLSDSERISFNPSPLRT